MARLEQYNLLDNTYIVYTSDNGFHIGQHRLTPGKRCPYEEDVNVPLVIRGPGVPKGQTVDYVTSHTDLTPTVVEWTGAQGPGDFDGVPIPVANSNSTAGTETNNSSSPSSSDKQAWEHVQLEFWGAAKDEQNVANLTTINTYKALRVIAADYNIYYSVWCDGDHELYNMQVSAHRRDFRRTADSFIDGPSPDAKPPPACRQRHPSQRHDPSPSRPPQHSDTRAQDVQGQVLLRSVVGAGSERPNSDARGRAESQVRRILCRPA